MIAFMVQARTLGFGVIAAAALTMLGPGGSGGQSRPAPQADLLARTQEYLRAHPGDARTWASLGNLYAERARRTGQAGYLPKAEGALQQATKLEPGNVDALVGLGAVANIRHDFTKGYAWGVQARRADPRRASVHAVLFDAAVELGRPARAGRALRHLTELRADVATFTRAARLYELRGQSGRATEALRRAADTAVDPVDIAFAHHRLGELQPDPAAALREYDAALRADPTYAYALAGRAGAQAALGAPAEAAASYQAAINRLPAPKFLLEYGELLLKLGRDREANAQFAMVRATGDRLALGRYETGHGDPRAAVLLLRSEWRQRKTPEVAGALDRALRRAGRPQARHLAEIERAYRRNV
ncbi:hypothetical protein Acor_48250 [Acrocarpospora corrugata]|uniref:Tetratricopeptide repeat protein n=1 Tax=Acrocarpospora corrugata TaxID=35763 RepID=A0A5M3W3B8_9ACTN|nr:hypothetical protein [Acrocarpospora corrugata]GES02759.1 hypothetical protein Acor_48250 [Acrocarpospora corrugata]